MTEQPHKQAQKQSTEAIQQPGKAELYGMQGNEGQYGQGQYDSEGKPDPHGRQAQQIQPDVIQAPDQSEKQQGTQIEHVSTKEGIANKKKS